MSAAWYFGEEAATKKILHLPPPHPPNFGIGKEEDLSSLANGPWTSFFISSFFFSKRDGSTERGVVAGMTIERGSLEVSVAQLPEARGRGGGGWQVPFFFYLPLRFLVHANLSLGRLACCYYCSFVFLAADATYRLAKGAEIPPSHLPM